MAIFGAGVMGQNHIRVLQKMEHVEAIYVYDPNTSSEGLGPKVVQCSKPQEIMDQRLDYAVIATPTAGHESLFQFVSASNIPMLIEKPVASNIEEAERILNFATKSNLFCAVGHVERFNPAITLMRKKLNEGILGRPFMLSTVRVGPNPKRVRDVGVILDLATHDIDLAHFLSGASYEELSATTKTVGPETHEGVFVANGTLGGGVVVTHNVNWHTPRKERRVSVLGELGMLEADLLKMELRFHETATAVSNWSEIGHLKGSLDGDEHRFAVELGEPLSQQHRSMQSAIAGVSEEICSLEDAVRVMRVIEEYCR